MISDYKLVNDLLFMWFSTTTTPRLQIGLPLSNPLCLLSAEFPIYEWQTIFGNYILLALDSSKSNRCSEWNDGFSIFTEHIDEIFRLKTCCKANPIPSHPLSYNIWDNRYSDTDGAENCELDSFIISQCFMFLIDSRASAVPPYLYKEYLPPA